MNFLPTGGRRPTGRSPIPSSLDFPAKAWEQGGGSLVDLHPRKNGLGRASADLLPQDPHRRRQDVAGRQDHRPGQHELPPRKARAWSCGSCRRRRSTGRRSEPARPGPSLPAAPGHGQRRAHADPGKDRSVHARRTCAENLVVLMLMLPSANRKTKETLEGLQGQRRIRGLLPAEDDIQGQDALLEDVPESRHLRAAERRSGAGRSRPRWATRCGCCRR